LCSSCERINTEKQAKQCSETVTSRKSLASVPSLNMLFAAAASQAHHVPEKTEAEDLGLQVRIACDILYKCCVYCWVGGRECTTGHLFNTCSYASGLRSAYTDWADNLIFPSACCFYCGGPQRVSPQNICFLH
jgi:hypothetical protein